ncbi:hypothetical protein [Rummeliibacillus sp. TYF-LIM-RU47]|nr:hypothetical protein [Rummeliibacillus sp. TYF-LIM-RU47]
MVYKNGRTQPSDEALIRMIRFLAETSAPRIVRKTLVKKVKEEEQKCMNS